MPASHLVGGKMEGFSSLRCSSDYLMMVITQFIDYAGLPTEEVTLITWQGKKKHTHTHKKLLQFYRAKLNIIATLEGKEIVGWKNRREDNEAILLCWLTAHLVLFPCIPPRCIIPPNCSAHKNRETYALQSTQQTPGEVLLSTLGKMLQLPQKKKEMEKKKAELEFIVQPEGQTAKTTNTHFITLTF